MMFIAALLAIAPVPANNPGDWVNSEDYPKEALASGAEGTVVFELDVNNDGLPTKCVVVESAGNDALDKATCELVIARAKFKAAGETGYTKKNTYRNRVRWAIPVSNPEPPLDPSQTYSAAASFSISSKGELGNCESTVIGQLPEFFDLCKAPRDFFDVLGKPLDNFGNATLRFIIQPVDAINATLDGSAGKTHKLLYAAKFDVLASGVITNCSETEGSDIIRESLCSVFQPERVDFIPNPGRTTPIRMQIVVDLTATPRN